MKLMSLFKNPAALVVAMLILFIIGFMLAPFQVIPAGHVGVSVIMGKVQPQSLSEGFTWKTPFMETIHEIDNRTQVEDPGSQVISVKGNQSLSADIAVSYHFEASSLPRIYKDWGMDKIKAQIAANIPDALKSVTNQYSYVDIFANRDDVRARVRKELSDRLRQYGVIIVDVAIKDMAPSAKFKDSIEAKQIAEQAALKAQYDLQKVKAEAEQSIARANAEAEALRLQKEQVTPELIELRKIEVAREMVKVLGDKWKGEVPNFLTLGASNSSTLLDVTKLGK